MNQNALECHRRLMKLSWKVIRLSRKSLNRLGFAWNQYTVMKSIQPGESVTLSEISARCFKENSNITTLVDFLEEKGIVQRVNDKKDRRVVRVQLTEEGEAIRKHIIQEHECFLAGLYDTIGEDSIEEFMKLVDVFDQHIHE